MESAERFHFLSVLHAIPKDKIYWTIWNKFLLRKHLKLLITAAFFNTDVFCLGEKQGTIYLQIFVAQKCCEMLQSAKLLIFVTRCCWKCHTHKNFGEKIFCEHQVNHKIHENTIPWRFGAIRYVSKWWMYFHGTIEEEIFYVGLG